jgi:hypothetical protein
MLMVQEGADSQVLAPTSCKLHLLRLPEHPGTEVFEGVHKLVALRANPSLSWKPGKGAQGFIYGRQHSYFAT